MKRFWQWLCRQGKEKIVTAVTLFTVLIVGVVVLLNASKFQGIFDPEKFERFGNRQEGESYDSVAGDGLESDLADRDGEGNGRDDEEGQKAVKTEGTKQQNLIKSDDDEGIGRTTTDTDITDNIERNPDAYEVTDNIDNSIIKTGLDSDGGNNTGDDNTGIDFDNQGGTGNNGNVPAPGSETNFGNTPVPSSLPGTGNLPGPTRSPGSVSKPEPTDKSEPTRKPEPTRRPEPDITSNPGLSLSDDEQTQLKPRDPIYTEDGELLFLSVETPENWMFCVGDTYDSMDVTVRAVFRKNGQQIEKTLSYGGTNGYSVVFSTNVPGSHTAIFIYNGITATVRYQVLSSHAAIRYYAEAEGKIYTSADFPGPVNELVSAEDEIQRSELEELGKVVYPSTGSVIDLMRYHRLMIAYLGEERIRRLFADFSDTNYRSVTFLETDSDGYLTNMLGGFQYCLSSVLQQDGGPYIYYPASADWGYISRALVNVVKAVPEGYKIRREVSGKMENLPEYLGEQVLEKYTGEDTVIEVPMGVTKIDFKEVTHSEQVTALRIPESVSEINTKSVAECLPDLNTYSYEGAAGPNNTFKVINGALYSNDGKTLISVPPGMTSMPDWSPDVTAIAPGAFWGSRIKEIEIPETVTDFAPGCFEMFSAEKIHITGKTAPKSGKAADTGYKGIILMPDSMYDTILKDWMFAFADEDITFGTEKEENGIYRYDKENNIIVYKNDTLKLAGIPSDTLGVFQVPKTITSIGAGAFISCSSLHDIELPESVKRLEADSLVLPDNAESITIQGSTVVEIAPQLFGNPDNGAVVPDITVYVPEELYEDYLSSWKNVLDSVYGTGTAQKLLHNGSGGFFYENGARYQTIPGDMDTYRLVKLYDLSRVSFKVKDKTTEVAEYAFSGSESLEIIYLPDSVAKVGENSFLGCKSLQTVTTETNKPELDALKLTEESGAVNVQVYEADSNYKGFIYGENGEVYGLSRDGKGTLIDVPTDYAGVFTLRADTVLLNREAFSGCWQLTGINSEDKALTGIGDSCFENCTGLKSMDLSAFNKLESIGNYLFYSCSSLAELILPDGIKDTGVGMCYGCTGLVRFHASGLRVLGDKAFAYCSRIGNMNITGVAKLGAQAFMGCSSTTEIVLPETLKEMGEECFSDCTSLQRIYMNGELTAVSRYAFAGCRNLVSINMSDRQKKVLRVIGVQAFASCISLESVDFGECTTLKHIGTEAFSGCSYLTRVTLPEALDSLPDRCFADCGYLSILELLSDTAPELDGQIFGDVISPYMHLWVKEKTVAEYRKAYTALLDNRYGDGTTEKILGVIDPQKEIIRGVTYQMTEEGRVLLEADSVVKGELIVFQDTVRIADDAFKNCTQLTEIELPDNSNIILGDRCFEGCSALKEVRLYGNIPQWGEDTFRDCTSVSRVELGNNVSDCISKIGDRAFKGCTGLVGTTSVSAVSFSAQITKLGTECFSGCSEMAVVTVSQVFEESLENIEDRAFEGCRSLGVLLNSNYKGLKTIGAYAFTDCDSLRMPAVPAGVTSIGEGCFSECDNLQYVSFYGGLEEYPKDCFRNCPKLIRTGGTSLAFTSLKRIGEGAYEGCSSLQMPLNPNASAWHLGRYENLEEIGQNAFRGCDTILFVSVPETVKKIGKGAFANCTKLQLMEFLSAEPPDIEAGALDETAGLLRIQVPGGDDVYHAYLEKLTPVLGEELTKEILFSAEDKTTAETDADKEQEMEQAEVEK